MCIRDSQKAMNLLGLPPDPTPGVYLAPLLAGGDEANQRFLDKLGQGETLNECEVRLVDAVGEVFEALVSVNAISFSGQAVMVLGITSISELKRDVYKRQVSAGPGNGQGNEGAQGGEHLP